MLEDKAHEDKCLRISIEIRFNLDLFFLVLGIVVLSPRQLVFLHLLGLGGRDDPYMDPL